MKFKDFTQEAYDDIQSYMGGEEQWEEINKTYGVVETKGIFQYDYESQLSDAVVHQNLLLLHVVEAVPLLLIIELHQDFHLAIAIHIGAAGIIRLISSRCGPYHWSCRG